MSEEKKELKWKKERKKISGRRKIGRRYLSEKERRKLKRKLFFASVETLMEYEMITSPKLLAFNDEQTNFVPLAFKTKFICRKVIKYNNVLFSLKKYRVILKNTSPCNHSDILKLDSW